MLHKFQNNHILKLFGIRSGNEPWIVMEYAELGSLNSYLRKNKSDINLRTLLLFSYQISLALYYLENLNYVHKNVAIENVLVFTPSCVKLSGFEVLSFSKNVEYKNLPIRWMSPESIKFNEFIQPSVVWSFGK